ncbi:MAG: hypothetical protein C0418_00085 [Coriobacteriaceae bacterium]|nr:hypothetical protein [Coriobacteriaceae bacterium]
MWDSFRGLILQAVNVLYAVTGDYGFAIILLTIAMRVLLIPLTVKQTVSMHEMQRIQPKIKELQAKYKNDKEKLQEETLKFYQENKVNPFGGCLPLLLQMPIFIALFQVLSGVRPDLATYMSKNPGAHPELWNLPTYLATLPEAAQAQAKAFWIIIPDITMAPNAVWAASRFPEVIPYAVLAVLFALSVWLPQQLGPGDQQQKRIGAYMSLMMLYFGWISPAGVLVYWVTSSAWQIGQQAVTVRMMDRVRPAVEQASSHTGTGGGKTKEPKSKRAEGEKQS